MLERNYLFMFTGVGDVLNDTFQIVLTVNDFTIAASRPNLVVRNCTRFPTKNSRRVGFELISHEFRLLVSSHREMHMIGSGIDPMQNPATNLGMFAAHDFNPVTLILVQEDGALGHSTAAPSLELRLRGLVAFVRLSPPPRISGQPCSIGRPSDKVGQCIIHF